MKGNTISKKYLQKLYSLGQGGITSNRKHLKMFTFFVEYMADLSEINIKID